MQIKNPYVDLIKTMRSEGAKYNPPSIELGVVISVNPMIIKIGPLQITEENLLVNDFLLTDYTRTLECNTNINRYTIKDIGLKKDDKVACMPTSDYQTYIVLCKVVNI